MSGIGVSGFILIIILALILFGPKKLPELGRAVGTTLREFKNATKGLTNDDDEEDKTRHVTKATTVEAKAEASSTVSQEEREKLEREIRDRLERERLETEAKEKMAKERTTVDQVQPKA